MKTSKTLTVIAIAASLITGSALGGRGGNGNAASQTSIYQEVDGAEAATLSFMREEEKLARDMYLNMHELWSANLFGNIAKSEQRHMDAVKKLLDKYDIADPADPDSIGDFSNLELQALYDDLLVRGEISYLEALMVGALIEEVDIEDNENAIQETDNDDLAQLYENLLRGSRNHLRAYVAEIERQGVVYEAQYLEQSLVDEIVDSPMERGGRQSNGMRAGARNNARR